MCCVLLCRLAVVSMKYLSKAAFVSLLRPLEWAVRGYIHLLLFQVLSCCVRFQSDPSFFVLLPKLIHCLFWMHFLCQKFLFCLCATCEDCIILLTQFQVFELFQRCSCAWSSSAASPSSFMQDLAKLQSFLTQRSDPKLPLASILRKTFVLF